jgi:hypothetical protein
MNGHLRRCRCGNPSSRTTQYAPGGSLAAPCIWPLFRHLQGACGRVDTRAFGALRFLNRLQRPNTRAALSRLLPVRLPQQTHPML